MNFSPENAAIVLRLLEEHMGKADPPAAKLQTAWNILLRARIRLLTGGVHAAVGGKVFGGPFKGMVLTDAAMDCFESSLLLGCYEHELHPVIAALAARDYRRILNIGCSVGYYAVGLARLLPAAMIEAFDIEESAQKKCAELAQANGVQDRVRVSGLFRGEDFAAGGDRKTLVFMDIEGAEVDLLDPARYPALAGMDMVVELHDVIDPAISGLMRRRFAPTHDIEIIPNRNALPDLAGLLPPGVTLDPLDHMLLGYEGRSGPTPWGVFRSKILS